jgi:hypothetical protein
VLILLVVVIVRVCQNTLDSLCGIIIRDLRGVFFIVVYKILVVIVLLGGSFINLRGRVRRIVRRWEELFWNVLVLCYRSC